MKTKINKSELQSYYQKEQKMFDLNEKALAFAFIDQDLFNQYDEASTTLFKELDAQIDAACISYGIDRIEFINQLNNYTETLN